MIDEPQRYPVRKLDAVAERIETGPTQFGDDWPGVFIRGDNAAAYAMHLRALLYATPPAVSDPFGVAVVRGLVELLESSRVWGR